MSRTRANSSGAAPETPHRAVRGSYLSDNVAIDRGNDGTLRYFRQDDPNREEYTYRKPFILELEITRHCNLRCVHCYAEAEDRDFAGELTLAEIGRVLDQAREIGMRELSLTGGEVFCRPDFLNIVDAGLERGFHVRFVTNATLLDDRLLAALCERPIKLITVSLDAVSPEAHERIRGPGTHARAVRAIDRFCEAGLHLSVITAISRLNFGDLDDLLAFCVRRRIDWQVQITSAKGRCPKDITLSPDEYYELGRRVARAIADDPPINIIPMDDLATFSHFPPLNILCRTWQGKCTGGLLNLFVRADGNVTPCSALCFAECVVGNLRRDSLKAICDEERCRKALSWLSAETLTGVCAACPYKLDCRGGCPEILLSMCRVRSENEYCYHRIEQDRILKETLSDA